MIAAATILIVLLTMLAAGSPPLLAFSLSAVLALCFRVRLAAFAENLSTRLYALF
jgi:hypothetical protein